MKTKSASRAVASGLPKRAALATARGTDSRKYGYSRMDTGYGNSLTDYSRDLVLRDGAMLRFRALRPGDRDALNALLSRCSLDSIRYRFLHSIKELPEKTLDQLAQVEGSRVVTLVVIQGGRGDEQIIAVGQYHALEDRPDVAEVSFLVEDAMPQARHRRVAARLAGRAE